MNLLHTAHVPAGEGPFPTVVALHGWGASAHDLLGLAHILHGGEALVLCPQGPVEVPIGPGMVGFGWFPLKPGEPPDPDAFLAGAAALRTFVEEAPNHYPVDRQRLVLLGFSQGGAMAYDLGLRHPEQVAGIAAMASWLPHKLAATIPKQPRHTGLPVLVLHGNRDPMVDVERARESREALRPFGVSLTYRELDMEHEISREALQLLVRWLDERVGGAGQIDGEAPQG